MISYLNHTETESTKAHTDIMLNGEYIGYYIKDNEVLTAFIEIDREMYAGDFKNTKQLEITIKNIINP
jgi:hypothetical protein